MSTNLNLFWLMFTHLIHFSRFLNMLWKKFTSHLVYWLLLYDCMKSIKNKLGVIACFEYCCAKWLRWHWFHCFVCVVVWQALNNIVFQYWFCICHESKLTISIVVICCFHLYDAKPKEATSGSSLSPLARAYAFASCWLPFCFHN